MLGRRVFAPAPPNIAADPENKQSFQEAILGERAAAFGNERAITEIQSRWAEIAGPLARHSLPLRIKGTKLHVRVEKSVYAQELSLHSSTLLKGVHQVGHGHLKRIMIDVGAIDWSSQYGGAEQNKGPAGQKNDPDDSDIPISPGARSMLDGLEALKNKDQ